MFYHFENGNSGAKKCNKYQASILDNIPIATRKIFAFFLQQSLVHCFFGTMYYVYEAKHSTWYILRYFISTVYYLQLAIELIKSEEKLQWLSFIEKKQMNIGVHFYNICIPYKYWNDKTCNVII